MITLFTSDGSKYTGMDEATVTRLRLELGKPTTYVDEKTYNDIIAAIPGVVPPDQTTEKTAWQSEKLKGTPQAIQFLAKKLGLE